MEKTPIDIVLDQMYASEIAARIAWSFDLGFSWFIVDQKHVPARLPADLSIMEDNVPVESPLQVDFFMHGSAKTFERCVWMMAGRFARKFPDHSFSKWYNSSKPKITEGKDEEHIDGS